MRLGRTSQQGTVNRNSSKVKTHLTEEGNLLRLLDSFFHPHTYERPEREFNIQAQKMATAANYVVPAVTKHTATVIMAHGLGDRFVLEPIDAPHQE